MWKRQFLPFLVGTRRSLMVNLLGKEANAIELAREFGINESAIRRHLEALERDGLVSSRFERRKIGRPTKIFSLTPDGRRTFPRRNKNFLSSLIQAITQRYGEKEVNSLMSLVARDFAERLITNEIEGDLERRLKQLVQLLDDYGFFTSMSKRGDKYVIEYRNCVFEDVIPLFGKQVCNIDEEITKKFCGEVKIEWEERIAEGDKRCLQIISCDDPPNSRIVTHKYKFASPNTLQNKLLYPECGGK